MAVSVTGPRAVNELGGLVIPGKLLCVQALKFVVLTSMGEHRPPPFLGGANTYFPSEAGPV